ncbi:hypothetical protein BDQ17DRAFT_1275135 [Cyathus striatus]|nr:hypothetical protein BDQ17DRAFT_1275135 [Cyathus striatus]
MSNDDEDDYLSDKFLFETPASLQPKTYSNIRNEAQKKSLQRNEQNKTKSRRQREIEAREEGLRKSLFERAKEEEAAGVIQTNKALSIMMKMGFKPGQSLGNAGTDEDNEPNVRGEGASATSGDIDSGKSSSEPVSHRSVPLPLTEWAGKKGIGLGKRARSPTSAERAAKMAKMADESTINEDFRDRARHEYQERRAEARLGPAQRTCITLDERSGKSQFNVLWLNPGNPNSFPEGLLEALTLYTDMSIVTERTTEDIGTALRRQMQADALHPLDETNTSPEVLTNPKDQFPAEVLEEATQFLRLQVQDRLQILLQYLRDKYAYCFWCGMEYKDDKELQSQCPGPSEDDHD